MRMGRARVAVADVERLLEEVYVAAEGAHLRQEDRRKARQVAAMLDEIDRAMARLSRRAPLVLVDAAAGKSYVGLLAAALLLAPEGRSGQVVTIERDPRRVAASERAARRLDPGVAISCRVGDAGDERLWPVA